MAATLQSIPEVINVIVSVIVSIIASTRSAVNSKLAHHLSINIFNRHFYFTRLPHLWNAMPIININQPLSTIKVKLKTYI